MATEKYEATRGIVQRFLGARHEDEIVFTTGSTMGINMVSYAWAAPRLEAGDEIVLSVMEHHANIVPWHFLRERQGVVLKWVEIEPDGSLDPERVLAAVGPRTKLIAVTHMSNVLGTVVDVKTICTAARAMGVPVLVDGSQAAVHMAVDVSEIGCDFYVVTGHKLYGPTGSGALYATARAAGGDAAVPRRRRHDPRGAAGRDHLRRPAAADGGGDAGDRADDRARGGARLHDRARARQHRGARAEPARLCDARGSRG